MVPPDSPSPEADPPLVAESWQRRRPLLLLIAGGITLALMGLRGQADSLWVEVGFILAAAVSISVLISEACDPFADAAQWVGVRFKVPPSVRGATLDAVASSMPELFTGLFFVVVALTGSKDQTARILESAEGYGSTIATCAGSSVYNLILIPAACAIAVVFRRPWRPYVQIDRAVVNRDGLWVVLVQAGLLIFLFQPKLHWWMALLAILAYGAYVSHLYLATRSFRRQLEQGQVESRNVASSAGVFFGWFDVPLNGMSASLILLACTAVAATACYFLVELTNSSAENLGVSPFFVAVILTAAVSSIPDTFMSVGSSLRGDDSGAVSNVFGSNIFDICIGMSIPLLVSCYLNDWQPVQLVGPDEQTLQGVTGLRILLFIMSVVAMSCMWKLQRISGRMALLFCFLYAVFVGYAVAGGLGLISV